MPNLDKALDFTGIRYYLSVASDRLLPDDAATRADLERVQGIAGTAYRYMGTVPTVDDLPAEGNAQGDVYSVGEDALEGDNYAWTGTAWDKLVMPVDLSQLISKDQLPELTPLMSEEDRNKLDAAATYAKRVQVDGELDDGRDGPEATLLDSQVTMYAESPSGEPVVMGSALTYSSSCSLFVPMDSVASGETIAVNVMGKRGGDNGAVLRPRNPGAAMNFKPSTQTSASFSGIVLEDENGEQQGVLGGSWAKNAARGVYRLTLTWTGGAMYMMAGRTNGGPVGVNFTGLHAGAPKTVIYDTSLVPEGGSTAVKMSADFFPASGSRLAYANALAAGMTADTNDKTAYPRKGSTKRFQNVGIIPVSGTDNYGLLTAIWARVEDGIGTASLWWDMPGEFVNWPAVATVYSVKRAGTPPKPILTPLGAKAFEISPGIPCIVNVSTDGMESEELFLSLEASNPADSPEWCAASSVSLNPEPGAFGVSADGNPSGDEHCLKAVGDSKNCTGLIPRLHWLHPNRDRVDGQGDENVYGTFIVKWSKTGTDGDGFTYACSVLWAPPAPHAFRALSTAKTDEAYSSLIGPSDSATSSLNGYLSWQDKQKLDGIEDGANATPDPNPETGVSTVVVDGALASSSVNPVQTVEVYGAVQEKITRSDHASAVSAGGTWTGVSDGTITAEDYGKLKNISSGAKAYGQATADSMGVARVDAALSAASVNPVQTVAASSAVAAFNGSALMDRTSDQTLDGTSSGGTKTFLKGIIGNLNGSAVYAEGFADPRAIVLSGALEGSGVFTGLSSAVISAEIVGGVPAASVGQRNAMLKADGSGGVLWKSPLDYPALDKETDQEVRGVKDFRGSGNAYSPSGEQAYNGLFTGAPSQDGQVSPVFFIRDMLRAEVERRSENRNTIVRGIDGSIHYMVVIPKFKCDGLPSEWGAGEGVHPAFIVNGAEVPEILVGKYLVSSRPGSDRSADAGTGKVYCTVPNGIPIRNTSNDSLSSIAGRIQARCGKRFQVNTVYNWGAAALLALAARGATSADLPCNDNYGAYSGKPWQTGRRIAYGGKDFMHSAGKPDPLLPGSKINIVGSTLTGSGPSDWTHDGTEWGICDMAGNCAELITGAKFDTGTASIRLYSKMSRADNGIMLEGASTDSHLEYLQPNGTLGGSAAVSFTFSDGRYVIVDVPDVMASSSEAPFSATGDNGSIGGAAPLLRQIGYLPLNGMSGGGTINIPNALSQSLIYRGGSGGSLTAGLGAAGLFTLAVFTVHTQGSGDGRSFRLSYLP